MSINGSYTFEKNENFDAFLKALGAKDERIQKMTSSKPVVDITLAGSKLTISSKGDESVENCINIGAPSTFKLAGGLELDVNLTQSGNNFTGTLSKGAKSGKVTVEFNATHLIETFSFGDLTCKRVYKRN